MAEGLRTLVVDTTSEKEGEADVILHGYWKVQDIQQMQDDQGLNRPDAGEQTKIRLKFEGTGQPTQYR